MKQAAASISTRIQSRFFVRCAPDINVFHIYVKGIFVIYIQGIFVIYIQLTFVVYIPVIFVLKSDCMDEFAVKQILYFSWYCFVCIQRAYCLAVAFRVNIEVLNAVYELGSMYH